MTFLATFSTNVPMFIFQPGEQPTSYSDEDDEPIGSSDKSGAEQEKADSEGKKNDSKPEE